jgi:ATP-binding cassette subfamily A (ABC1) protein 3
LTLVLGVVPMNLAVLGTTTPAILSFFFPPMFYIFALKVLSGFETYDIPFAIAVPDPAYELTLQPMIIASVVSFTDFYLMHTVSHNRFSLQSYFGRCSP